MIGTDDVLSLALQLPEKERANIAHELLISLEPEINEDAEVSEAWQQEIEKRLIKISEGRHKTHDWRQAINEIRQEIRKDTP